MRARGAYHEHHKIQTTAVESLADAFPSYHISKVITGTYRESDHSIVIAHVEDPITQYRTLLANVGTYAVPNPEFHVILHVHAKILKPVSDLEIVTPGVGIVIANRTPVAGWAQKSRQLTSMAVGARSAPKVGDHVAMTADGRHGFAAVEDGSVIMHSPGGTIVGGKNGLYIGSSNLILATGGTKQYGVFQEPPSILKYLPSLFFLPNASRWPDLSLIQNVGGIMASAGNIAKAVR
tara:strand:+ start:293 stop:1000 length:708 start_codon:yes stop_codon:yes gene_type:complete